MAIGIICAMQEEMLPVSNAVLAKPKGNVAGRMFFTTKYRTDNGIEDTLVFMLSGVGRTNAARATASLVDLGCRAIFNFGTCGCTYTKEVKVGDRKFVPAVGEVWVPNLILDGEYDVSALSGKIERDPVSLFKGFDPEAPRKNEEVRLYTVNHFSEEPIDKEGYLVDMEAYDILSVCDALRVPCRIVKVVSDCANGTASNDFEANLRHACTVSVAQILSEIDAFVKFLHGMDKKATKPKIKAE